MDARSGGAPEDATPANGAAGVDAAGAGPRSRRTTTNTTTKATARPAVMSHGSRLVGVAVPASVRPQRWQKRASATTWDPQAGQYGMGRESSEVLEGQLGFG